MRILCVSGYPAWDKVSRLEMPSHHLFGIHEMIDHYEKYNSTIRGIIKQDVFDGGYVDFYLWRGGKNNIIRQTNELRRLSKNYDLIFDMLNRCSAFLGIFRRLGMMNCRIVTIMHHPPYKTQLRIADSDAYIFFNSEYKDIALRENNKKSNKFFVNEWKPDIDWYHSIPYDEQNEGDKTCFYIDNGKSRRDRKVLIEAADKAQVRVDYAGDFDGKKGWARSYKVDLKDDIAQLKKLRKYKAIVIPIQKTDKEKIGPLGITSYLDAIALGIPVIASDNVCFAKEIVEKRVGCIFETGNSSDLRRVMDNLISDKDMYEAFSENQKKEQTNSIKEYSINLANIIKCSL